MRAIKLLGITVSLISMLVLVPSLTTAEEVLSIYGGRSTPEDENVTVGASSGAISVETTTKVDFENDYEFGGRLAYWFTDPSINANWFGMAMDVSYFKTEAKTFGTDIWVVPISGLIMFRYPGRFLQPYVGVGGGIFISHIEQDIDLSSFGLGNLTYSDTVVDAGFDARAGLELRFLKGFAVFGEGRYTYFSPKYTDTFSDVEVNVKTNSEVYHFLAGISYHF